MACFAHLGVTILTIQGFMGQLPKERARDREIDQCWRLRAGAFCHRPEHWLKGYASASGAKPGGGPRPWQVLERHHHRDRRHAKFPDVWPHYRRPLAGRHSWALLLGRFWGRTRLFLPL